LTPSADAPLPGRVDVVVAGGGPVGLVMAGLLGAGGTSTLVVERKPGTSDEPKAISVDDESLRTLQRAGLDACVYPILLPGTGTRYYGANGRLLVHAKGRRPQLLGHPFKSSFAQPELERALAEAVSQLGSVEVRFSTELLSFEAGEDGVRCRLRLADGSHAEVATSFLVGCDGAKSRVRGLLGIRMEGRSFDDVWLVADTLRDRHRERYAMHFGDPVRPRVLVPGRDGRCRYELKLRADEVASAENSPSALAAALIRRYRDIDERDIERCTAYRFHALVAERWRVGRVFLAGDAAHLMPPFAGQGLNSGIRDADNLAWKLRWVLEARATPALLETYEPERRPHADAMVRLSVRLGRVVMTTDPKLASARDTLVRVANAVPAVRRYLSESRYKPAARYVDGFVSPPGPGLPRAAAGLVGRMLPQPRVLTEEGKAVLLDDVLSDGFALVSVGCGADVAAVPACSRFSALGCRLVAVSLDDSMPASGPGVVGVADVDGRLQEELGPLRGTVLLVRPDRYVAAAWAGGLAAEAAAGARRVASSLARFLDVDGPAGTPPGGLDGRPWPTAGNRFPP
jgi:3-(3-hydroxy-phenyl)propionate hydroxylase